MGLSSLMCSIYGRGAASVIFQFRRYSATPLKLLPTVKADLR
jgi:hypothetical protein